MEQTVFEKQFLAMQQQNSAAEQEIIQSLLQNGYPAIPAKNFNNDITIITCINNGTIIRYFLKRIFNVSDIEIYKRIFKFTLNNKNIQIINAYYKEHMPYLAFIYSYNNIGKSINSILEFFDIELTDRGLFMKENMQFLSFNPQKITEFLNMDYEKYQTGFQSQIQLNNWLSKHQIPSMNNKEITDFFNA